MCSGHYEIFPYHFIDNGQLSDYWDKFIGCTHADMVVEHIIYGDVTRYEPGEYFIATTSIGISIDD